MHNRNTYISLVISLFSLYSIAQERTLLEGRVQSDEGLLENVAAKNISTGRSSATNNFGIFQLLAKEGDTLVFSHIGMNDLIKFLDSSDVRKSSLTIKMVGRINELEEVAITDVQEINAVSLGIIPKEIQTLSINERRLAEAGDFKWTQLLGLVGGGVPVNPILNAISGRTKKLKRNIVVEKKIRNIAMLEGYTDYMKSSMNLTEVQIGRLISLAVEEENIRQVLNSNNENQVHIFLIDTWLKFQHLEE